MNGKKKIIILAGPNGAGKTTFAREFLLREAECPIFVNADLIASGLSPFTSEVSAVRAGRVMLGGDQRARARREELRVRNDPQRPALRSGLIPRWRRQDYRVKIILPQAGEHRPGAVSGRRPRLAGRAWRAG